MLCSMAVAKMVSALNGVENHKKVGLFMSYISSLYVTVLCVYMLDQYRLGVLC